MRDTTLYLTIRNNLFLLEVNRTDTYLVGWVFAVLYCIARMKYVVSERVDSFMRRDSAVVVKQKYGPACMILLTRCCSAPPTSFQPSLYVGGTLISARLARVRVAGGGGLNTPPPPPLLSRKLSGRA